MTTWKNVSCNLPNAPVNGLAYDQANDTLYAATFGRGTWRIPLVAGTPRYDVQAYDDLSACSRRSRG